MQRRLCRSLPDPTPGVRSGPATVQGQTAYIGSGGAGGGTLNFRGRSYPLNGGGIGGIRSRRSKPAAKIYKPQSIEQLPGD